MTEYKCLDCGNKMEYEGGLLWNASLTECFYGFKCPNCGSSFNHRLTKEEEDESMEWAKREKEENIKTKQKENEKETFSLLSLFTPKITMFILFCVMWFSMIFFIAAEYTQGRGEVWITPIVLSTAGLVFMLMKNRKRGENKE